VIGETVDNETEDPKTQNIESVISGNDET